MFFSLCFLLTYIITISSSSIPSVKDSLYYQEVAHRSTYNSVKPIGNFDILPFNDKLISIDYDKNAHCYIGINSDNYFYSSKKKFPIPSKESLENPFNNWIKVKNEYTHAFNNKDAQLVHGDNSLFLVSSTSIVEFTIDLKCRNIISSKEIITHQKFGVINSISYYSSNGGDDYILWLGCSSGLYQVNIDSLNTNINHIKTISIDGVSTSYEEVYSLNYVKSWNTLFVSTKIALVDVVYIDEPKLGKYIEKHDWIGGNIDTIILDFTYDAVNDCLWIAEENSIHKRLNTGQLFRYGQHKGAILGNITTVEVSSNGMFLFAGTKHGLMRLNLNDPDNDKSGTSYSSWSLYSGPRYLPSDYVTKLKSITNYLTNDTDSSILVVTSDGISYIDNQLWTLAEKEVAMHSFQYPRHDRNGITAEVYLSTYGDLNSYSQTPEDSDGIWTSQQVVSASMRYSMLSKSNKYSFVQLEEARLEAWRGFEALEILNLVTGVPGLLGRTFCSPDEIAGKTKTNGCGVDGEGNWHASIAKGYEGWIWKGDTSSDTIDGHIFAYGIVLDTIAKTNSEKKRVVTLLDNLVGYIMECDLYYIDITGDRTKWGRWNPIDLNSNPQYYSERGANSVEILAFLSSAYSITKNIKYYNKFQDLVSIENDYYRNAINSKIDNPSEDNHSDNELIGLAYHTLFYSYYRLSDSSNKEDIDFKSKLLDMVKPLLPSVNRYYSIVARENSPMWLSVIAIASHIENDINNKILLISPDIINNANIIKQLDISISDVNNAIESLRRWSIDLIQWETPQNERWDVVKNPFFARDSETVEMRNILPPQERLQTHWNSDPYPIIIGNTPTGYGGAEYAPAEWSLPYWSLVFYGVII